MLSQPSKEELVEFLDELASKPFLFFGKNKMEITLKFNRT